MIESTFAWEHCKLKIAISNTSTCTSLYGVISHYISADEKKNPTFRLPSAKLRNSSGIKEIV